VLGNDSTLAIASDLDRNGAKRAAIVAEAQSTTQLSRDSLRSVLKRYPQLDSMDLAVGWGSGWDGPHWPQTEEPFAQKMGTVAKALFDDPWRYVVTPIFGWLATAFAVALGAPFWFDLMNKVMVIRSTVKPHEKSPEEASEDRQRPAPAAPLRLEVVAPSAGPSAGGGGGGGGGGGSPPESADSGPPGAPVALPTAASPYTAPGIPTPAGGTGSTTG
jgi:hypothetical protein